MPNKMSHLKKVDTGPTTDYYKEMEMENRLLIRIINSTNDGIIGKDLKGNITSWNHGAEQLYGYKAEEIKGQSIMTLVPPEGKRKMEAALRKVIRGKHVNNFEVKKKRKDGTLIDVSIDVFPVFDEQGGIIGCLAICRDISEKKNAEVLFKQHKLELQQKNAALQEMIEHMERIKKANKENIYVNVEEFIVPILRKLEKRGASAKLIGLIQDNLNDLTSSFGRRIKHVHTRLSPREGEICNMIKNKLTSKEIAQCLSLSLDTVIKHRKNIRKKLGISKKKENLSILLRSL